VFVETAEYFALLERDIDTYKRERDELRARTRDLEVKILELEDSRRALQILAEQYSDAVIKAQIAHREDEQASTWRRLSKIDAVQRALREAGDMTPTELLGYLTSMGRPEDTAANISAALSYLKRKKGTVQRVGAARWRYADHPTPGIAGQTALTLDEPGAPSSTQEEAPV